MKYIKLYEENFTVRGINLDKVLLKYGCDAEIKPNGEVIVWPISAFHLKDYGLSDNDIPTGKSVIEVHKIMKSLGYMLHQPGESFIMKLEKKPNSFWPDEGKFLIYHPIKSHTRKPDPQFDTNDPTSRKAVFHVAPFKYAEKILKNGIIPKLNNVALETGARLPGNYFWINPDKLMDAIFTHSGFVERSAYRREADDFIDLAIFKIQYVPSIDGAAYFDPEYSIGAGARIVYSNFPPKRVRLIGRLIHPLKEKTEPAVLMLRTNPNLPFSTVDSYLKNNLKINAKVIEVPIASQEDYYSIKGLENI